MLRLYIYGRMGVGAEKVKEREGEMKKMDDEVGGDDDDVGEVDDVIIIIVTRSR